MMKPKVKADIIIDLDSLFDTRLSVLKRINPKSYEYVMENYDEFRNRRKEEFPGVPQEVFRNIYKMRTKEIFAESDSSIMFTFLNSIIKCYSRLR